MAEPLTKKTITPALKKEIVRIIDQRIAEAHVTKEDFSELKSIVKNIAVTVGELAEAQNRTEIKVEELAEAQKRTEIKVVELAVAQNRTEIKVGELAEAQKRTENKLEELTGVVERGFKDVRDSISALGGRWGIMAEDTFRNAIGGLLKDRGYSVTRGYYGSREVDIIIRNGEHIMFEITSSMKKTDIGKYIASAEDYEKQTGTKMRIMVAAIYISATVMRELVDAPRKIEIFSAEE